MQIQRMLVLAVCILGSSRVFAQESGSEKTFQQAAEETRRQLEESMDELDALREQIAEEKLPLGRTLSELESDLSQIRVEYQNVQGVLDSRTLDLSNLRTEIKSRHEEASYLSNLLGEYVRNFESRLHIAEVHRHEELLEGAKMAIENTGLSQEGVYKAQAAVVEASLDRLHESLGGLRFQGTAVDEGGIVRAGSFVMVGPAAVFRSDDGVSVGSVEQRLGSLEPSVIPFGIEEDAMAASAMVLGAGNRFLLDPTLGSAHVMEATQDTFLEHVQKGGAVMYPIFGMASIAALVGLYKWIAISLVRTPSKKRLRALMEEIADRNQKGAQRVVRSIAGPVGRMLTAGVEHLHEPRDLVEEVMYEQMLSSRLKLQRWLPFIAICAAAAPLLGLLGTVTGIINTFKLITVFGSGDAKSLSGGISEALITTKFGLIVAIPSLLLHAFLSRKARGIIDQMEKAAVMLVNQVSKTSLPVKEPSKKPLSASKAEKPDPVSANA